MLPYENSLVTNGLHMEVSKLRPKHLAFRKRIEFDLDSYFQFDQFVLRQHSLAECGSMSSFNMILVATMYAKASLMIISV